MKKFAEWTGTLVGKLVLLAIALVLIGVLIYVGYYAFLETHGSNAKAYLIDKYDLDDFDYVCTGYVKYVYSEKTDCNKQWFKECTDDPNLAYKYTFTNKDKNKIVVIEYENGDMTDDYGPKDNPVDVEAKEEVKEQ